MTVPMAGGVASRGVSLLESGRTSPAAPAPSPTVALAGPNDRLDRAIGAVRDHLVETQDPDGFWVGELEGDSILES